MMLLRHLVLFLLLILVSPVNAREYVVSHRVPEDINDSSIGKITLILYATPEGGEVLEVHQLSTDQWQLKGENKPSRALESHVDTALPQPLWAEVSVDAQPLATRAALNAPGDLTAEGEIYSKSGFRFPDNSLQISAANTQALDRVLGGSGSCPAGSSIRAIDASGNVTCETDDVGGGVTQVNTGAGLTGGPITTSGTVSVANGGITNAMIQDGTLGTADIDSNQIQRRVSGSCPNGYMMTGINTDGSLQCKSLYDLIPLPPRSFIVDSSGRVGEYNSLTLDTNGHPVISYYDSSNQNLKLIHCNDPACFGNDESINVVDSDDSVGRYTSLVLDAAGYPVISYYDSTNSDLKLVHCNDPVCGGGDETINIVDGSIDGGRYCSLALDVNGYPVISYYDSGNEALKLAHCNDPGCSGADETITTVDSSSDVGLYTSLVLDASGHPVVSYYDRTNGDLKLLRCNDPACVGGDESINTVDSGTNVGRYTSLALGASDRPTISYYDFDNQDLKMAHCHSPDCNPSFFKSITIVDSDGDVGKYSSLVLDDSGYPVISYFDETNDDLKLVHCNDIYCFGGDDAIAIPDGDGHVGWYTSLALDLNGHPVISHSASFDGDLKLTKCSTPDCQ